MKLGDDTLLVMLVVALQDHIGLCENDFVQKMEYVVKLGHDMLLVMLVVALQGPVLEKENVDKLLAKIMIFQNKLEKEYFRHYFVLQLQEIQVGM